MGAPRTIPHSIGPFEILDILGEGGMGVVYRGRQHEPISREVAVKVLRPGTASEEVVSRFDAERQALAVMEHPAIAHIYDAGVTDDGLPYFAMELVRGVPLTEYADRRELDIAARLRLFVRVCQAVQHAHQKGIIHRDLKPSNVLVVDGDDGPLPKIIDFGIAKAVQGDEEGPDLTKDEQSIGTPAYMSPEQAGMGDTDVDTRADVYSLGVILYELLTGALPFPRSTYRRWASAMGTFAREVPRPSKRLAELEDSAQCAHARGLDEGSLRRILAEDLDWVVLRAMDRDREARYQTALELVSEIRRHLDHLPVEAGPPSRVYRVRKFVRRNRLGVALGSTLGVVILAFAVTQTYQRGVITDARDDVQLRLTQAESVLDFLMSDLWDKLEPIGRLELLDDVGAEAVEYFAEAPKDDWSDNELASRSQMLYQIGSVRMRQGALPAATDAFRESMVLARALSERAPEDTERLFALNQSYFWVGAGLRAQGLFEEALAQFQLYRETAEILYAAAPDNPDYELEAAYGRTNVGVLLRDLGRTVEASEAIRGALEIHRAQAAAAPDDPALREEVASSLLTLGAMEDELGRLQEAYTATAGGAAIQRALLDDDPARADRRFALVLALNPLGSLSLGLATPDARSVFEDARAELERLLAVDETNAVWRHELGISLGWLAEIALRDGDYVTAARHLAGALDIYDDLVGTLEPQSIWVRTRAVQLSRQARLDVAQGRAERAITVVTEAVAVIDSIAAIEAHIDDEQFRAVALLARALAYDAEGRMDEARADRLDVVETLSRRETLDRRRLAPLALALFHLDSPQKDSVAQRLDQMGYRDSRLEALRDRS